MDPQVFAQSVQQKVLESFAMIKSKMTAPEVYSVFTDINAAGEQSIGDMTPITNEINSSLEIVLQSMRNNNELNGLIIFNNTPKVQKANFCFKANIGQDKGFALLQVTNADQMNMNSSGQLLASLNQRININENYNLVLQPNDFILVILGSLGIKQEPSIDSSVSLMFNKNRNNMRILYALIAVILLLVVLYLIYRFMNKSKNSSPSDADISSEFYFF